jgi:hypothetical protein
MKTITNVLAVAALAVSGGAFASELIVTSADAKGGRALGLDIAVEPAATAFQARIALPAGNYKVDLSGCLSTLPKSHTGTCTQPKDGEVLVLVYSGSNASFGSNLVSVGQIALRGEISKEAVKVTEFLVSDASGNELEARASVE